MELEILRCVGGDDSGGEPCQSAPKFKIEGQGLFCGKHGKERLFEAAVTEAHRAKKPAPVAAGNR